MTEIALFWIAGSLWSSLRDFRAGRSGLVWGLFLGQLLALVFNPLYRALALTWLACVLCGAARDAFVAANRAEVKRLGMLELRDRFRYDVVHCDAGRRLLQWRLPFDEPVCAVEVVCPSTGQQYLLRVPPDVKTCHEAVAWTFESGPEQYAPLAET